MSDKQDAPSKRLTRDERRRQLLDVALVIVREEGADRLTLGHLAVRAGVSKPVVYDHFETRSALLIALYRQIDREKVQAFQSAMARDPQEAGTTIALLATAYIQCATETEGEFQAVGAALAGSEEKAAVFEELLAASVEMFVAVLQPHSRLAPDDLKRCCIGLVGAGEALASARLRGACSEAEAIATLRSLIAAALG
ncbi:TetR/AcrR family transcriptional regulator [Rhizobium sp. YIM 134829]|uniref:TetR/AcrR family transcriptional regulator n=1 Tax=Rhizobium sp. YIM 134829 TaxID=3390453 RepID=UPI00397DC7A5